MNDLLQLKGQFFTKGARAPGKPELPKGASITTAHLGDLKRQLEAIQTYWAENQIPFPPLVSVHYTRVIAKSNRIRRLLGGGGAKASEFIVGSRFAGTRESTHHVITYCVSGDIVADSLEILGKCAGVVEKYFGGEITCEQLKQFNTTGLKVDIGLAKTVFAQVIRDANYVQRFDILTQSEQIDDWVVVEIYNTGYRDVRDFLNSLGFLVMPNQVLGNAVRLDTEQYAQLVSKYPFLVSMAISDVSRLTSEEFGFVVAKPRVLPEPGSQPIVGVIDSPFDRGAYFSQWVESHELISPEIELEPRDYQHGTAVSSLIVDGPSLVPQLDDGCGRFRVRHFGVATASRSDSFAFMRRVSQIVAENRDIKVWNISQGSVREIARNFMSPEGAILDELQSRFDDIVFVVAGTNQTSAGQQKIGAPADSINSLVVNATAFSGETASYSRRGPVLDFFKKPDVCAVGGDGNKGLYVCTGAGGAWMKGTSFAAPWVARKMAYLMQVMGFSREVAKALIVDAAAGWNFRDDLCRGYGQVPRRIEEVVRSHDDEIKFVLTGVADAYETYNFGIPVPIVGEAHPFIARATLCYFPSCERRQGVDYTSTELDLHFGRVDERERIKAIDNNRQGDSGFMLTEDGARANYRKWDNVKHIGEEFRPGLRDRKAYAAGLWGLKIRKTTRRDEAERPGCGNGLRFGVVVTLRELHGKNRIDEFIQRCSLRGWIVNRVDIQNRLDIYNAAEVEIDFDD